MICYFSISLSIFPEAMVRSTQSFKDSMDRDILSRCFLISKKSGISSSVISPSAAMSMRRSFSRESAWLF